MAFVAESAHQCGHVGGHRALAAVAAVARARQLVAVAAAAQVGQHEAEVRREPLNQAGPFVRCA
jgi:hypothetical protein